ncbi:uncharacterized protein BO66DRAFT_388588 [Aspergillus aculeatinus CBS 121060]|uniref:Uncharacterized protein n=1 Tax=Aspergillus aculeatinus CBS 121060 TaxID=1448322 RepID=A0ACD1HKI2_9EURO|nr:hypothetical protein BO66DRAFT_388588 [Aspergillus aculeatinus CBS 121060]RAH73954.1 hypothetical protein BO66DRAFT_388588 [Aspergillus aculeatinus CBS 121060]
MRYWFATPDFTFHKNGALQLGTVLEHPFGPLRILACQGYGLPEDLDLPPRTKLIERSHQHTRSGTALSGGMKAWMALLDKVSAACQVSGSRDITREYGPTNHEVWTFDRPLSDQCLEAILEVPAVRSYMATGWLHHLPVYVVTGIRISSNSFLVTEEDGSRVMVRSSASAGDPTGTVPITAGLEADVRSASTATDTYETAPDIVFAYRVDIIRNKRDGMVSQKMFAHKATFMTGTSSESELEYLEVDPQILAQDISRRLENVQVHPIGDDEAWVSSGLCLGDH